MGMGWTKAQQKVIDTRNKNILVSAAAGSGKTAVLVERIISMISEGDHPIDIDHLLVVTFTNAAAAEMRGRIGKAIDEKLLKEPDNVHLQKQISLLQSAQITTIHSFCLNVIRNYFHRIDLDPSFKIADESEITLMKSDVISEVLESWYEEGREDFHAFIESYSYSKSDAPVEDLILGLYQFAMSAPWPKSWISEKQRSFELQTMEDLMKSDWMQELLSHVRIVLGDLLKLNEAAIQICNGPGGPSAYLPALISDRELLKELIDANSYQEYANAFRDISYTRLSNKREEGVDPQQKEQVKALRDLVKKGIKDLSNQFFFQPPEEMLADMKAVQKVMQVLFELTLDFMEAFAAKKEEKNLIDFNDLEHFALEILIQEKDGALVPSEAALELSEQYEEILIDEYQDSNLVQETILQSISRERMGKPNRFMVGDVKQSIYKFRLAMPELFMDKYKNYSTEDYVEEDQINLYQRIDLDRNFRSRKLVLDFVNQIFEQIMQEPVGGIVYDQAASLAYGGLYENDTDALTEKMRQRLAQDVELLLVTEEDIASESGDKNSKSKDQMDKNDLKSLGKDIEEEAEEQAYTKREMEARVIAKRIKELVNPKTGMLVYDKKEKIHRPATYRDIVILLRSMSGWSEVFVNTLMQAGIPAYADTGTGYFQTVEIMTLLNVLRIIDNPRQDIPLVGVLYSPIVGLTTTQLAMIRAIDQKNSMYTALLTYAKEGSDEELRLQIDGFLQQLESFRAMVKYTPIHELLQIILDQTGYYYYVMAMPGGERRKANIDMLLSQAVSFEKGSYSGLFHFIRYIEKLHKYEVDFGEAATAGEQDDTVRIMSIHKSKGLEFPIVFVGGMSKQFNTQDLRNHILLHNELGVGPEYIDSVNRTKVPTLLKKVIQKKVQVENLGEELRVLYVAMTRAREKLIMTGSLKSLEEIKKKDFSFFEMISAKTYLDWVLPAMVNRIGTSFIEENKSLYLKQQDMVITVIHKDNLLVEEVKNQIFLHKDKEELLSIHPEECFNKTYREEIGKRFDYQYPYKQEAKLKVKMTVSELKRLGQFIDDEDSEILYPEQISQIRNSEKASPKRYPEQDQQEPYPEQEARKKQGLKDPSDMEQLEVDQQDEDFEPTIPSFIRQKEEITTGADRGTIYHKVLKLLDLTKIKSLVDLKQELSSMVHNKKLKKNEIDLLNIHQIYRFTTSNIASRMRKAQMDHKLYREQQFVIGLKAKEISKEFDSDELILIQGIIDVFFEEDGELVLLDYKSDYVQEEKQLIQRYEVQLDYYRKALEQMFMKNVKERIIYSLHLGKEIRIE